MDPVQALAILSLGAFLTVLVTAIFYVFTVRPRLLEPVPLTAVGLLDDQLQSELLEQRAVVERLNVALLHHAQQLESAPVHAGSGEGVESLRPVLRAQSDAVQLLTGLLNDHAARLGGLDGAISRQEAAYTQTARRVEDMAAATLGMMTQMAQQNEKLDRLETHLGQEAAQPAAAPELTTLMQAQADRLVSIGTRLDEWAATRLRHDDQLAEHARTLAELDRQMAAQADLAQRLDAKVSEHTTMLLTAAADRQAQTTLLERVLEQIGQLFPLVKKRATPPPRAGQDRLTDIRGIGPVYSSRFYEAGIHTFKQLAALTPDEVRNLVNAPKWRAIDAEGWIEQAGHFASQREKVEKLS